MAGISNQLKVGFADDITATAPTFTFMTLDPVYVQKDRPRHLLEEVGRGDRSYSGMFVENSFMSNVTVKALMTRSLLYRILKEHIGTVGTKATATSNFTYTFNSASTKLGLPTYSYAREFAMFYDDGTNMERMQVVLTNSKIIGETNGMVMCELTLLGHSHTPTSITFPDTFNETNDYDKYSTGDTSLFVQGTSSISEDDLDSFSIEYDMNISDLKQKLNNKFRAEGGSRNAMIRVTSTLSANMRTLWEQTNPAKTNMRFTFVNGNGDDMDIVLSNLVPNERTVNPSINEVIPEDTTWTSAPLATTGTVLTVKNTSDIVSN